MAELVKPVLGWPRCHPIGYGQVTDRRREDRSLTQDGFDPTRILPGHDGRVYHDQRGGGQEQFVEHAVEVSGVHWHGIVP